MNKQWIAPLLLIMSLALPTAALANNIELLSRVEIEVIKVNDQGEKITVREPAAKVVPGDSVIYTNTYRNIGKETATDLVLNNPIPEHLNYVADSAFGAGAEILFSADGGKTFALPEKLKKTGEDGTERLVRPEEYTHLRWIIKGQLKPSGTGDVGFRARLQ